MCTCTSMHTYLVMPYFIYTAQNGNLYLHSVLNSDNKTLPFNKKCNKIQFLIHADYEMYVKNVVQDTKHACGCIKPVHAYIIIVFYCVSLNFLLKTWINQKTWVAFLPIWRFYSCTQSFMYTDLRPVLLLHFNFVLLGIHYKKKTKVHHDFQVYSIYNIDNTEGGRQEGTLLRCGEVKA